MAIAVDERPAGIACAFANRRVNVGLIDVGFGRATGGTPKGAANSGAAKLVLMGAVWLDNEHHHLVSDQPVNAMVPERDASVEAGLEHPRWSPRCVARFPPFAVIHLEPDTQTGGGGDVVTPLRCGN